MSSDTPLWDEQEAPLVRYLLGELPAAEQEAIEDRLFADRAFLDEVLATSDDLIHAYLTGSLTSEDKGRFESHFLASPLRRQRYEFLRDVVTVVQKTVQPKPRVAQPWMWAAAAAIVLAAGLLAVRRDREAPPHNVAQSQTPIPTTAPPPAMTTPPIRPVETQVVRLPEPSTEPVEIALSAGTRTVRLEVPIDDDRHPTFDAIVRNADGDTVWKKTELVPPGPGMALVVLVPAELLQADVYALVIEGELLREASRASRLRLRYELRVTHGR